jgi:hypothetical protein
MTLTPLPEDTVSPLPTGRRKGQKESIQVEALSSIEEKDVEEKDVEEKDVEVRIESLSFCTTDPAASSRDEKCCSLHYSTSGAVHGNESKQSSYSTPFGQPLQREVIFDPFGLPLLPQPLPDKQDPITWSQKKKIIVLLQVAVFSFLAQFLAMCIVSESLPTVSIPNAMKVIASMAFT